MEREKRERERMCCICVYELFWCIFIELFRFVRQSDFYYFWELFGWGLNLDGM